MQYIEKIKAIPYKIENEYIPDTFERLPDGNIIVTESTRRKIYLSPEEYAKAVQIHVNKAKFHEFELSEENRLKIKAELANVKRRKEAYEAFLNTTNTEQ